MKIFGLRSRPEKVRVKIFIMTFGHGLIPGSYNKTVKLKEKKRTCSRICSWRVLISLGFYQWVGDFFFAIRIITRNVATMGAYNVTC